MTKNKSIPQKQYVIDLPKFRKLLLKLENLPTISEVAEAVNMSRPQLYIELKKVKKGTNVPAK